MSDPRPTPAEISTGGTAERRENPYSAMLVVLAGGIAMALIIFAVGFTVNRSGSGGGTAAAGSEGATAVPVSLTDFAITQPLEVASGGSLEVTNDGDQPHDLVIDGGAGTAQLAVGDSESLPVDLAAGEYDVYCSIPGHREAGMEGTLVVTDGDAAGGVATPAAHGSDHGARASLNYAAMDQKMLESFEPFVEALTTGEPITEGIGGQELEPTITEDGFKEWTLTAQIGDWEVAPGEVVEAWTYNGTVPGPTLRGEVGDKIRIRVINNLPMGTDLHQHGMVLPNEMDGVAPLTQELIKPGEEFVYEYEVTEPAIGMYHPHHHGVMKIPNGMWGAMIFSPKGGGGSSDYVVPRGKTVSGVEIPADLQIAQEHNMLLNDGGTIGLTLNGKSFPATEGYKAAQGEWMLVNYYNSGSMYHPMHLHQFPQMVVARDGIPLDSPYFADTVTVGPGERYTVMIRITQPGVWVWHCHILNHVEREDGMFGMVTAIQVD